MGTNTDGTGPIRDGMIHYQSAQDGMTELQIKVQGTPNPNAAKFTLDRELPDGSGRSYFDAEAARGDQLAERLFEVEGVRALLLVDNFITVTKVDDEEWPDLVERIEHVIRQELGAGS